MLKEYLSLVHGAKKRTINTDLEKIGIKRGIKRGTKRRLKISVKISSKISSREKIKNRKRPKAGL